MRTTILVLLGLAIAGTGAFLRTCAAPASAFDAALARAWCGHAPGADLASAHCAGCAVMVAGLALAAAALIGRMIAPRLRGARA